MTEKVSTVISVAFIATHVFKCHIRGRSEYVYKMPADMLSDLRTGIPCEDLAPLDTIGVYLLFGADSCGNSTVYVGKANIRLDGTAILSRMREHPDINFTSAIVIVDDTWDAAAIDYLEHKFCAIARDTTSYVVINQRATNPGRQDRQTIAYLNHTIKYVNLLLKLMGHPAFDKIVRAHGL